MKRSICFLSFAFVTAILFTVNSSEAQLLKRLKQTVKDHVENHADEKTGEAADKPLDKAEAGAKGDTKASSDNSAASGTNVTASATGEPTLRSYQNYDFVPGDTVLFADDFMDDQEGEFPAHWSLLKGQGTVNKSGDRAIFNIVNGNYAMMVPRLKNKDYLSDNFTIEFDAFGYNGPDCGYGVNIRFVNEKDETKDINVLRGKTAQSYGFSPDLTGVEIKQPDQEFWNHWHHIALAYKKPQMKVYIDQNRVLVLPDIEFTPVSLRFGGIAEKCPISISNVRVASGGNMNMIGKKFTESKIVTHGINFDIDKATIQPESMGTLNMIVNVMKNNPDVKFEIDGHTDNTGEAAHNLTLSHDRADAVKAQLVKMGIDPSRLTTKGYGDTIPISDNSTTEGKANNRRVEFIKM